MKIWVGVTDEDWFTRLGLLKPDEVNFWQPSGSRTFRAIQSGEPFLFKLHSPKNFIVGGRIFRSVFGAARVARLGCIWGEKWGRIGG
jgi:putative restriction endonuclease